MQREAARREREAAGIDNDDRGDSPLNALHDEPVPNPSAAVQPPGEALEVETTLINQVVAVPVADVLMQDAPPAVHPSDVVVPTVIIDATGMQLASGEGATPHPLLKISSLPIGSYGLLHGNDEISMGNEDATVISSHKSLILPPLPCIKSPAPEDFPGVPASSHIPTTSDKGDGCEFAMTATYNANGLKRFKLMHLSASETIPSSPSRPRNSVAGLIEVDEEEVEVREALLDHHPVVINDVIAGNGGIIDGIHGNDNGVAEFVEQQPPVAIDEVRAALERLVGVPGVHAIPDVDDAAAAADEDQYPIDNQIVAGVNAEVEATVVVAEAAVPLVEEEEEEKPPRLEIVQILLKGAHSVGFTVLKDNMNSPYLRLEASGDVLFQLDTSTGTVAMLLGDVANTAVIEARVSERPGVYDAFTVGDVIEDGVRDLREECNPDGVWPLAFYIPIVKSGKKAFDVDPDRSKWRMLCATGLLDDRVRVRIELLKPQNAFFKLFLGQAVSGNYKKLPPDESLRALYFNKQTKVDDEGDEYVINSPESMLRTVMIGVQEHLFLPTYPAPIDKKPSLLPGLAREPTNALRVVEGMKKVRDPFDRIDAQNKPFREQPPPPVVVNNIIYSHVRRRLLELAKVEELKDLNLGGDIQVRSMLYHLVLALYYCNPGPMALSPTSVKPVTEREILMDIINADIPLASKLEAVAGSKYNSAGQVNPLTDLVEGCLRNALAVPGVQGQGDFDELSIILGDKLKPIPGVGFAFDSDDFTGLLQSIARTPNAPRMINSLKERDLARYPRILVDIPMFVTVMSNDIHQLQKRGLYCYLGNPMKSCAHSDGVSDLKFCLFANISPTDANRGFMSRLFRYASILALLFCCEPAIAPGVPVVSREEIRRTFYQGTLLREDFTSIEPEHINVARFLGMEANAFLAYLRLMHLSCLQKRGAKLPISFCDMYMYLELLKHAVAHVADLYGLSHDVSLELFTFTHGGKVHSGQSEHSVTMTEGLDKLFSQIKVTRSNPTTKMTFAADRLNNLNEFTRLCTGLDNATLFMSVGVDISCPPGTLVSCDFAHGRGGTFKGHSQFFPFMHHPSPYVACFTGKGRAEAAFGRPCGVISAQHYNKTVERLFSHEVATGQNFDRLRWNLPARYVTQNRGIVRSNGAHEFCSSTLEPYLGNIGPKMKYNSRFEVTTKADLVDPPADFDGDRVDFAWGQTLPRVMEFFLPRGLSKGVFVGLSEAESGIGRMLSSIMMVHAEANAVQRAAKNPEHRTSKQRAQILNRSIATEEGVKEILNYLQGEDRSSKSRRQWALLMASQSFGVIPLIKEFFGVKPQVDVNELDDPVGPLWHLLGTPIDIVEARTKIKLDLAVFSTLLRDNNDLSSGLFNSEGEYSWLRKFVDMVKLAFRTERSRKRGNHDEGVAETCTDYSFFTDITATLKSLEDEEKARTKMQARNRAYLATLAREAHQRMMLHPREDGKVLRHGDFGDSGDEDDDDDEDLVFNFANEIPIRPPTDPTDALHPRFHKREEMVKVDWDSTEGVNKRSEMSANKDAMDLMRHINRPFHAFRVGDKILRNDGSRGVIVSNNVVRLATMDFEEGNLHNSLYEDKYLCRCGAEAGQNLFSKGQAYIRYGVEMDIGPVCHVDGDSLSHVTQIDNNRREIRKVRRFMFEIS